MKYINNRYSPSWLGMFLLIWALSVCHILNAQPYGSRYFDSLMSASKSEHPETKMAIKNYLIVADGISEWYPDKGILLAENAIKLASMKGESALLAQAYLIKAKNLILDNKAEMAKSWLEESRTLIWKENHSEGKVRWMLVNGLYHQQTGALKRSEEIFQKAWEEVQKMKQTDLIAATFYYRGQNRIKLKNYAGAREDLKKSYQFYKTFGNQEEVALTLMSLAVTHEKEFNFEDAVPYYKQAEEWSRIHGQYGHQIKALLNFGWCLNDLFKYNEALVALNNGIALSLKYNFYPYYMELYSISAESYGGLEEFEKSIESDKMAVRIEQSKVKNERPVKIAECYSSISNHYRRMGRFYEALEMNDSAYDIFIRLNETMRCSEILNNKAMIYLKMGDYIKAKPLALRSLELINKSGEINLNVGRSYSLVGALYQFLGDLDSAEYYIEKAIKIAEEFKDIQGMRYVVNLMIFIKKDQGDIKGELHYLQQMFQLSKDQNSQAGVRSAHHLLGQFYQRTGNYKQAIEHYDSSLLIAKKLGNPNEISNSIIQKAKVFMNLGDYNKAADMVFEAIYLIESKPGLSLNQNWMLLADIYAEMKDEAKAIEYIDKAIAGFASLGDKKAKADAEFHKGNYLLKLKQFEAAEKFTKAALNIYDSAGAVRSIAGTHLQLAEIYFKQNLISKCETSLQKAFSILNKDSAYTGMSDALKLQAELFIAKGNYTEGLDLINQVIERNQKEGRNNVLLESLKIKSNLLEKMGRYDGAYYAYLDFIQIRDSIHNIDTRNAITRKELQFEYEKKESVFLLNEKLANERIRNSEQELELSKRQILLAQTQIDLKNKDLDLQKLAYLRTQAELNNQKIHAEKQQVENQIKEARIALFTKQNELQKSALVTRKNERNALMGGMLLIGLLLFFVSLNYYNQKKANQTIQSKNKTLSDTLEHLEKTQEQLIETEKQKNLEIEKSRIARDMHDEIGSGLTKISLLSEMLKSTAGGNKEQVEAISKTAGELVDNMSQIIWAMNPETNKLENFFGYLRKYSMDFFENSPIECRVNVPENAFGIPLNQFVKRNLFLVIKESLNNVMKHSGATLVKIKATFDGNTIQICISDNGKGFDVARARTMGNGLNNLIKRMAEIGGNFQIHSTPGAGTEMVCSLQFKPKEEDEMMK